MVNIQFQSNSTQVQKSNGRILTNIPEVEAELAEEIAEDLEDAIQRSIIDKGLSWTGELKNNVQINPSNSSGAGTQIEVTANAYSSDGVNYAAWHEFAKQPHFVPFKAGGSVNQPITQWAKEKGMDDGIGITVTPANQREGSFMAPAVREAIKQTRKAVRTGRNPLHKNLAKAYQ